jgi:hypothetical protein
MAARLGVASATLALLFVLTGAAQAQILQRLHVQSFTLTSDTRDPRVNVPFNVTLTIRTRENVPQLLNVYLPTFFGAEDLGDVRQSNHGPHGTVYSETLRLVVHRHGVLTIGSAFLDAIDARDGTPKRFISNGLRLAVVGGSPLADVWDPIRQLLMLVIELALLAAALFVVVTMFRRRPRLAPAYVAPAPPQPPAPTPPSDLDTAIANLRVQRDRPAVLRVRESLWDRVGAHMGETLSDVLRRPQVNGTNLRGILSTVERATFIDDTRLQGAIDDLLNERERMNG